MLALHVGDALGGVDKRLHQHDLLIGNRDHDAAAVAPAVRFLRRLHLRPGILAGIVGPGFQVPADDLVAVFLVGHAHHGNHLLMRRVIGQDRIIPVRGRLYGWLP